MKNRAPFEVRPGEPPPPSSDPLALLNYALARHPEGVTLVNFAGSVHDVDLPPAIPFATPLARVTVLVPYAAAENLAGPPQQQDAYILIHIDR